MLSILRSCSGTWRAMCTKSSKGSKTAPRIEFREAGRLFYYLSCVYDQIRRNGEAKGPGGFQVNDLLESRGLLDWDVGGLRTSQNFVHMVRSLPVEILIIRPVRHQTAGLNHSSMGKH